MSDFEDLQKQITQINNRKIQLQTLSEQAKQKCAQIEAKYNVTSQEELQAQVELAKSQYETIVEEAKQYIAEAQQILSEYSGVI